MSEHEVPAEPGDQDGSASAAGHSTVMTRRLATVVVSGVLLIALVVAAALLPVPYVSERPGPTENTLGSYNGTDVIVIEGRETYPTEGNLDLTTVSVTPADAKLNLLNALYDWFNPQVAVVPREEVYSTDETAEESRARNAEQMATSQDDAIVAALTELGIGFPVVVSSIQEGAPALGRLKAGDVLLAVDGEEVVTITDVGRLVTDRTPGDPVVFTVERAGAELDVEVETVPATDGTERPVIGIGVGAGELPFDVSITLGQDIGGPSAGLMFSLGVIDKLTPGSLTGGKYVAGTGGISWDGSVTQIGGIQLKIYGARAAGATVFLVPDGNCAAAEAADIEGVQLVRVAELADAVDALEAIAAGRTDVPSCATGDAAQ